MKWFICTILFIFMCLIAVGAWDDDPVVIISDYYSQFEDME
jgi:hypothetical protein